MASDNETETTCKQLEFPGVNRNPEDASKEGVGAGSSKLGVGFFLCRERGKTEEELQII